MSKFPSGELKVYPNNDSYRWYFIDGSSRKYLPRKENRIAEELAMKKYYQLKRNALLEKRENIIKRQCEGHEENEKFHGLLNDKGYMQLIGHLISNDNKTTISKDAWLNQEFKTNPNYQEQLTFLGQSGNYLRSKSEVFIDMVLTQNGIPFRYECELVIGNTVFYPDFTILNPANGEIVYWEHFGKMDDKDYARNAFNKIKTFYEHGLIPGKNLILTFETKDRPFSYFDAENALKVLTI